MAVYPALSAKIRLQPEPSAKAPKIEKLEHRDLFFSSQSARSHVERYLGEQSAHRLSFRFEQNAANSWLERLMNHSNALLVVEKAPIRPAKARKEKVAATDRLAVRLLEFDEITRTPLLQKALVAVSAEPYKVQRFAFVPKTGELYAEAAFEAHGIQREERPGWQKVMGWLREKMPYQPNDARLLGVDENLSLRFGRRLRFDVAEQWRDQDGNVVQVMDLMRLDNARLAQVVRVQEQSELDGTASLLLDRADLKKSWRDKILGYIESVEQRGYFMQPGHIRQTRHSRRKIDTPTRPLPTMPPQALSPKSGLADNPFATVNFSGKKLSPVPQAEPSKPVAKPSFKNNPFSQKPEPPQK